MKVKHITVSQLFGLFDHSIPLNADDRITIVYGPNGFGKTYTLTLVDELLNPSHSSYVIIERIPFHSLTVEFDNGSALCLTKKETDLEFALTEPESPEKTFRYESSSGTKVYEPDWLCKIKRDVTVRFIHTERLRQLTSDHWDKITAGLKALASDYPEKTALFADIVNNRFIHKRVTISGSDGFHILTSDGRTLPPTNLSSGEQHVIFLLFELLFNIEPDSLILIDEPELSLHIVWQQEFLRDLQAIIDIAGFDVLVATHSPQIIHDRWDLTVELRGPGE